MGEDKNLEVIVEEVKKGDFSKVYYPDTSVFINHPGVIETLAGLESGDPNVVLVPELVRSELDGLKGSKSSYEARTALNYINCLYGKGEALETEEKNVAGVKLNNGAIFALLDYFPEGRGNDERIVKSCRQTRDYFNKSGLKQEHTFVSDDVNARTTALKFALKVAPLEFYFVKEEYSGRLGVEDKEGVFWAMRDDLRRDHDRRDFLDDEGRKISLEKVCEALDLDIDSLYPNQFLFFEGEGVARIDSSRQFLFPHYRFPNYGSWLTEAGQRAYDPNGEQECALELLCDKDLDLVALRGVAGVGKTMLALDVGLSYVEREIYDRIVYMKSGVDADVLGFLPGSKDEKLEPWLKPCHDNLLFLNGFSSKKKKTKKEAEKDVQRLYNEGKVEYEERNFLQGRTLPGVMMIVDETQNLEPNVMKHIISRAGKNSKVVLLGDTDQIKNPKCNEKRNGLVYVMEKFRGQYNFGVYTFSAEANYRSDVSKQAVELL